ncbi:MAG: hypothetical protein B6U73_05400 [Desulfurococcales archaeon ex4484_204]|nr:MAG: hypothetical protein B6U73_05400 [Desulfurococcales archaeon ex4484_204]
MSEERGEAPAIEEELLKKMDELLNTMKDWERKPLIQVGKAVVEIVKLPKRETARRVEPERLALHVRLEDSFKGIFIIEANELKDLLEALRGRNVMKVIEAIDLVNRKRRVIEYKL